MSPERRFLKDVLVELSHLRRRLPDSRGSLTEVHVEMDELMYAGLKGSPNLIYVEAVQLTAAALRFTLDGDSDLDNIRLQNDIGIFTGKPV